MFSDQLRRVRREKGLSQGELALRAGINRSYLSMIENGHSSPTLDVAERLANGLGVSTWVLISEGGDKHYTYDPDKEFELYDGLRELLESEEDMLLINPSVSEIELLKSIRFSGNFSPSRKFFMEALIDFRKSTR